MTGFNGPDMEYLYKRGPVHRILSNSRRTNVLRREGTKAWPNGPDLRSGFEGIQGFKSLLSHIFSYCSLYLE